MPLRRIGERNRVGETAVSTLGNSRRAAAGVRGWLQARGGGLDFASFSGARVVDLSLALSERLPGTWPGHMTYAHHNWNWFAEVEGPTGTTRSSAPYQTNFIVIDEHCGTHFDAPTHFVPPPGSGLYLAGPLGDQTGDRVPLEELMGPAVVVDVRFLSGEGEPGVSPFITADQFAAGKRSMDRSGLARSCSFRRAGTATTSRAKRARDTCTTRSSQVRLRAGLLLLLRPLSTFTSAA